jgi:transcriptional regulator with XRE-family HTH domain
MHYVNHNLKFYREYNRYSQQEIANKLKTTLGRIKMYDRNGATPQIEMLIKIADMMQISLDTLIRTKLSEKNYLVKKGEMAPDLACRLEAVEFAVNKIVNKIPKKELKTATAKK